MADAIPWASVLRAWSDAKEAPPVGVVGAVVHELAGMDAEAPQPVTAEAVLIEPDGSVTCASSPDLASLVELLKDSLHGLVPGRTGDLMPPRARAGLEHFRAWDGDPEEGRRALRDWLRAELGPLATEDEVWACCEASAPLDPELPTQAPRPRPRTPGGSVLSSLRPRPPDSSESLPSIPVPELAEDEGATESPRAAAEPLEDGEETAYEAAGSEIERLGREGETREDDEARTVVRHESTREQPVSIPRAPAARRSAAPRGQAGDSILMPAEGGPSRLWPWILVGLLLGAGAYVLLMG